LAAGFIKQFGLFPRHSRQCWANVVGACPHIEVRRFLVAENLYEEEANEETSHYELLVKLGEALELTKQEIDDAVPLPTTQVAFRAWEGLTRTRDWVYGLAAKGVLELLSVKDLSNVSAISAERWQRQLDLTDDEVEFFSLHAELDQEHGGAAFNFIFTYGRPDQLPGALEAAKTSLAAFGVFVDGIGRQVRSSLVAT
jgi:pyrroloquinoline quinone (PQQ) biosynthesis protein C